MLYFNNLKDKALHWPLNLNSFVFSRCWLVITFLFLDSSIYFWNCGCFTCYLCLLWCNLLYGKLFCISNEINFCSIIIPVGLQKLPHKTQVRGNKNQALFQIMYLEIVFIQVNGCSFVTRTAIPADLIRVQYCKLNRNTNGEY